MKTFITGIFLLGSLKSISAIRYWDGGALDGSWSNAVNWVGDIAPTPGDDVILDNLHGVASSYTVSLPFGNITVSIGTLLIAPSGANSITLILPNTNTAVPGLTIDGAGDACVLNNNAILKNASGAITSTTGIDITNTFRINNGGRYIHNTSRANMGLVTQLSTVAGTETGIFEFDVPTAASYAVSLSGRTFGSLILSSLAAGGAKTYTGNGAGDLTIRGNLTINSGAIFNTSMTANIYVAGNAAISGTWDLSPASGTGSRSIIFNGTSNQIISGSGPLTFGANFKNIQVNPYAFVTLQRNIILGSNLSDSFIVNSKASLQFVAENLIAGTGTFIQSSDSWLGIGSSDGIYISNNFGNVRTGTRTFSITGKFEYNGTGTQNSGTGLPASVKNLSINNSAYQNVILTNPVNIDDSLLLQKGFLYASNTSFPQLRDSTDIVSPSSNYGGISNIGWERSFVYGPMVREISSSATKWFPVGSISGTDTLFAPVAVQNTSAAPVIDTAAYFPVTFSDTSSDRGQLHHISSLEYWKLSSNISTVAANGKVTLSWRPFSKVGDYNNNPASLNDLVVTHYFKDLLVPGNPFMWHIEGNDFLTMPKNPTPTLSYGTVTTNVDNSPVWSSNSTGYFTLGTRTAVNDLPLTLLYLNATPAQKSIMLNWKTVDEKDLLVFEVEKSADGSRFSWLFSQNAANGPSLHNYQHTDEHPLPGWNYYRLRVVDRFQHISYSPVVRAWMAVDPEMVVYPNPAEKEIKINLPIQSSTTEISIVNSGGQVVKEVRCNQLSLTINIETLSSGLYFIYLRNNQQAIVQRFIKK